MLPIKSMNSIVNQASGPIHMSNDKTLIPTNWLKKFMDEITSNTDNSISIIFLINKFVKYCLITPLLMAPATFSRSTSPMLHADLAIDKWTKLIKAIRMTKRAIKIGKFNVCFVLPPVNLPATPADDMRYGGALGVTLGFSALADSPKGSCMKYDRNRDGRCFFNNVAKAS